ncbi:MAG: aminotransferase class IV [Bacteroidales bacterium]|jgi:branched-chain amino acid aminotransferase|nr:aminotransferase class IV [Bacteroidales bacterium]
MEIYGTYYYFDGAICLAGVDTEEANGELSFYEVIRTRNGIPVFFDDHMKRLTDGIATRYSLTDDIPDAVRKGFGQLVKAERFPEINVKVNVTFTGQEYSLGIYYIKSSYPTIEMYRNGVDLTLYRAERFDPGVKLLNNRMRLAVNEVMKKRQAYEALLVNNQGYVTEGSRSNVFFMDNADIVYTAPDPMILKGITRKYVIDICKRKGIRVVCEAIRADDIKRFAAVFITGTSPMVLPARRIDNAHFSVKNMIIEEIREEYEELMNESIREYLRCYNAD